MMYAKFFGHCLNCNEDIFPGEAIKIVRHLQPHLVLHADCKPKDKQLPSPEAQDELERAFLRGELYPDPVL